MKFFDKDGNQAEIQMYESDNVDWSDDFFGNGGRLEVVEIDSERFAKVEDCEYCIDQAIDWLNHAGDYSMDESDNSEWSVDVTLNGRYTHYEAEGGDA